MAETCYLTPDDKRERTLELLAKSPLERILSIGQLNTEKLLELYDRFLQAISDEGVREALDKVEKDNRTTETPNDEFSRLKYASQHFSWELSKFLHQQYDTNHPIFHSLIF